ncbi:glycosyl transferase, family 9 [Luminiphilus syltensis NOR5-1B]|uniref:Glycosyl transferase, family 9 n=1 Tax=Luminiphilus syltensis NOR5-1B TaxID=565045 RepID=B8KQP9_9GAMM|nr:glycosyltransferase family 9 protein [Luminiphilus syltensis]EED34306.1 glycosyl transferase, family 9 [Luminiphilus syltensis NOR5-1B]
MNEDSPHVLIVRLGAIGDGVFASPLIGAVKRTWPDAKVSWLAEPALASMLSVNPDIEEVVVWPRQRWQSLLRSFRLLALFREVLDFRRELKRRRFDQVFDVQGLLKSAILARLTGAPQRTGLDSGEPTGWLMTRVLPKSRNVARIGSEYLGFAEAVGLDVGDFEMQVATRPGDRAQADRERLRGRYAVLCPFTTRPQKHWFVEQWRDVAIGLADRGLRVLLLGGPGDVEMVDAYIEGTAVESRAGLTTLTETSALIERAEILIGVDTGLTHMGIANATPTVALFGSTCPYTDTTRENAVVLYRKLECSPCRRNPTCEGRFDCMREITPAAVLAQVDRLLAP